MAQEMNISPIKIKDLSKEIIDNIRGSGSKPGERLNTFVWGPPGIGKSQLMHQVASKLERPILDFRANLFDPVDVRGIPFHEAIEGTNMTYWAPPSIFPYEHRDSPEGIFFLDELTTAPTATQNAFLQLCLDRKVGDYTLPNGWSIVGASNRLADMAAVYEMTSAMKDRWLHYILEPDVETWCEWAAENNISDVITSFIRFRPNLLHDFDPTYTAFPTPRSYQILDRKLRMNDNSEEARFFSGVSAILGNGAAGEFVTFKENRDKMPDIDSIIRQPNAAKVPKDEPAIMYAIAGALAAKATSDNFDKICTYAGRMAPEFQVVLMRDALSRTRSLGSHPAYQQWVSKNATEIL